MARLTQADYDAADNMIKLLDGMNGRDNFTLIIKQLRERLAAAEKMPPPTDARRIAAIKEGRDKERVDHAAAHAAELKALSDRHAKDLNDQVNSRAAAHAQTVKELRAKHAAEIDGHKQKHAARVAKLESALADALDPAAAKKRQRLEQVRAKVLGKLSNEERAALGLVG